MRTTALSVRPPVASLIVPVSTGLLLLVPLISVTIVVVRALAMHISTVSIVAMTVIIATMVSATILRLGRCSHAAMVPITSVIISHVASVMVMAVATSLTVVSETTLVIITIGVVVVGSAFIVVLAITTVNRVLGNTARSVIARLLVALITVGLAVSWDSCGRTTIVLRTSFTQRELTSSLIIEGRVAIALVH
jgi:hypothetical protein